MPPLPAASPSEDAEADFLDEASAGDQQRLEECLLLLASTLPASSQGATSAGAARLLASVSSLPLRYAPFFHRLAGLWEMSEERVQDELLRAKESAGWRLTLLPGVRSFAVETGAGGGRLARLMRFAPGVQFPAHRHRGEERVLVLEGSYRDSDGRHVGPGDEQRMPPGSRHSLHVAPEGPCVAAIVERGLDFTGPLLRWVSKLLP